MSRKKRERCLVRCDRFGKAFVLAIEVAEVEVRLSVPRVQADRATQRGLRPPRDRDVAE